MTAVGNAAPKQPFTDALSQRGRFPERVSND